jgi:triosephosphate isomerase
MSVRPSRPLRATDHHGENDWALNAKIRAAVRHRLVPILCVGEGSEVGREVRQVNHTLAQVDDALTGVASDDIADMLIAYEPVWAIGTGHVATREDAQEVCVAIRFGSSSSTAPLLPTGSGSYLVDRSSPQPVRRLFGKLTSTVP